MQNIVLKKSSKEMMNFKKSIILLKQIYKN